MTDKTWGQGEMDGRTRTHPLKRVSVLSGLDVAIFCPDYLTQNHLETLQIAIRAGRVSRLTAPTLAINHLVKFGLLTPSDLAGIWKPTVDGLCVGGYCPF